jgi:endonuclease YncB( thermonuclease family)
MKLKLSKQKRRKLIFWVIAFIFIIAIGLEEAPNNSQILKSFSESTKPGYIDVIRVDDGDTITVSINNKEEKVRFIGIDTPETQHPKKPVQCFGRAAQKFTENLISNQQVRLIADPKDDDRDIYNRLLRYVYLPDGTLVNAEVIRQGYGFAYTVFPFTKKDEFRALEKEARLHKIGLWDTCQIDESDRTKETGPEISFNHLNYTYAHAT